MSTTNLFALGNRRDLLSLKCNGHLGLFTSSAARRRSRPTAALSKRFLLRFVTSRPITKLRIVIGIVNVNRLIFPFCPCRDSRASLCGKPPPPNFPMEYTRTLKKKKNLRKADKGTDGYQQTPAENVSIFSFKKEKKKKKPHTT